MSTKPMECHMMLERGGEGTRVADETGTLFLYEVLT